MNALKACMNQLTCDMCPLLLPVLITTILKKEYYIIFNKQ